jgi:pilus assembly protein CpaE
VQMLQQRYGKERISVIVSRFDKQNDIAQHDIERVVGLPVSHVLPSDYRLALRAMNQGRPLALDNHNKLAAAYREVARDLAGLESGRATNTTSGGLFSRLTGRRQ